MSEEDVRILKIKKLREGRVKTSFTHQGKKFGEIQRYGEIRVYFECQGQEYEIEFYLSEVVFYEDGDDEIMAKIMAKCRNRLIKLERDEENFRMLVLALGCDGRVEVEEGIFVYFAITRIPNHKSICWDAWIDGKRYELTAHLGLMVKRWMVGDDGISKTALANIKEVTKRKWLEIKSSKRLRTILKLRTTKIGRLK